MIVLGNAGEEPLDNMSITLPEATSGTWEPLLGTGVTQPDGTTLAPVETLAPWEMAIVRLAS